MSNNDTTVETIEQGLKIIDNADSSTISGLKKKELGLQYALLGLAEAHAKRIRNLVPLISMIEENVFNEETIRNFDPSKLVALYQLGTQVLNDSSTYVKSVVKSVDWASIEAQLLIESDSESDNSANNHQLDDAASKLLSKINLNKIEQKIKEEDAKEEKKEDSSKYLELPDHDKSSE